MSESERKNPEVELRASPFQNWNVFEKLDLKREYTAIQDVEIEAPSSSERAKSDFGVAERKASNAQRKLFAVTGFFLAGILFFIALLKGNKEKLGGALLRLTSFRQVTHPEVPGALWGVVTKPFPTGAFWTNLAVKNGDGPVAVYPYGVKTTDVGIQVSYGAGRRVVSQTAIIDPFAIDLQIAALQGYAGRSIESYDNVSVTMGYRTVGNGKYRTHLVKGSPFLTVVYDGATPVISSPAMRILRVDARVVQGSVGVQYIVTLGNFQKWLVYCSEPVALVWKENTLSSPNPIRGVIRVAILPTQNCETAFNTLLGYVQRYPTGAALTFTYPTGTLAYVNFQFNTVGIGPLLMYTLPHHTPILVFPLDSDENRNVQTALSPIWCIKGKLKPIVGDLWKLQYNMVNVGWNYQLTDKLSTSQLDEIARQLMLDVRSVLPTSVDPYTFGKELARMSRLALIADNLGIADARQIALGTIESAILPWLQDANADALLYDKTYGGVISTNGLADPMADYGSGWYSDHHFHYGYFVYAAATLARLDVPFWDANKQALETIVRDICNPDPTDPDFPFVRHKDFFDGHSWASGLFQQANGKGQESSSEAVNAYYAAYLYALATANLDLTRFAHLLLTMEIQSAQVYWHMTDDSIYDAIFAANRMVGNIGALDVTASTWFGNELEYVHGINMMPVSPATAFMLDTPYVQTQYPLLASRLPPPAAPGSQLCSNNPVCASQSIQGTCCPTQDGVILACCDSVVNSGPGTGRMQDEWKALIYADHAVIDRDSAWKEIKTLGGCGPGGSKSNSLFWVASRTAPITNFDATPHSPDYKGSVKAACSANSACDAMGITGNCCPTDASSTAPSQFLGCCPQGAK